jgi:heterodisulfide reductase subunit C
MSADIHQKIIAGLSGEVLEHTGVNVNKCYQCGKCTAGCPLANEMDFPPSYVMRMLQTGYPDLENKILKSFTIWVCLTCEMCYSRCPMSIDIPKMMDFLREKSLKEKKASKKAKEIIAFHKSFLSSIEKTGRLYELGLTLEYKARTMSLMQDLAVAPAMLSRGKLHILPELIKGRSAISSIFKKTIKKNKK